MRALAFALFVLLAGTAAAAVHSGKQMRAQVLDAESGAPLEGVVIVARWEWLEYRPRLHGSSERNEGDPLHIAEAVTGADGRFVIPSWGPKVRATGRPDDRSSPKLSLFKSGYAPLQLHGAESHAPTIRLKRAAAAAKEQAEAIRRFQGDFDGGLWWQHQSDNWKSMPRMILALHREKRRLGEDGRTIYGANLLHGRSGRGELRDAASGAPVRAAVIQVAWTLRREGGNETRRFVEQRRSGVEGDSEAQFYVSPWRVPGPSVPGWEIAYDTAPLVRVYAQGYRKSAEVRWNEAGGTVRLERLPDTKEAQLAELRAWRRDADAELAAASERQEALAGQQHLLRHLSDQCRTLTIDVHPGICLPADSEIERYVEQVRRTPRYTVETAEGPRDIRIVASTASPIQAQSARSPSGAFGVAGPAAPGVRVPGQIAPVGGFSIEPVK